MEWVKPESRKTGQEVSNRLAIAVDDVNEAIQKAKDAGMVVKEDKVKTIELPHYGEVQMASAYVEDDVNRFDFVAF
jgi:hypothetical protein